MSQRPYLNLGAGRIILPAERPAHHVLVDEAIYAYPLWHNVDRNMQPGIDECVDLFRYPWPWDDNSFNGALLSHLVEHIPHEIRMHERPYQTMIVGAANEMVQHFRDHEGKQKRIERWQRVENAQDGWFAFFAELYRVLTPGAMVYIIAPYATSHGWLGDPTHTRPITEQTFQHSMQPNPDAPFEYATGGINFRLADVRFGLMPRYQSYAPLPTDDPITAQQKSEMLDTLLHSQWNVVSDLYVKLEAVK